jgi:inosose dehydratase
VSELQAAAFPADGAFSLEYEENEKNPLADIRECAAVARAAMKAVSSRG